MHGKSHSLQEASVVSWNRDNQLQSETGGNVTTLAAHLCSSALIADEVTCLETVNSLDASIG